MSSNTAQNTNYATLTIAASGTTSPALPLQGRTPVKFALPVSDSTSFSFSVSIDGGATYQTLKDTSDAAIAITKTAAAATTHTVSTQDFAGLTHLKIVAGTAETSGAIDIQVGLMEV